MDQLRSRAIVAAFLLAALCAALMPFLHRANDTAMAATSFPGWPSHYEGHRLTAMALTQRESAFVRDFPGRVGRFSDGRREIIVRWIAAPTRRLHSAADCFRASGYSITPMPVRKDAAGVTMGCFRAIQRADNMMVCELIRDEQGETWPDVSAWYWHAMFGSSRPPWWSFVTAERE